ncbi:aminoglycoside phosphotransferase family protein [Alkanindiges sp. WGS2144]|uniref:aminoglycoside phosphotransferase family protein n=1 Tax=Alkanindiges sp. WGS2144 TaxID=3366808 RepID=UPI00375129FF
MGLPREQVLIHWVQQQLNDTELSFHPLAGDASFRRYARIKSRQKTYMLMDAPPDKEDSQPFVAIDQWLDQHGVRVPHIVAKDLNQGFILLEDFGDTLLSRVLNDNTVDSYYQQAMNQLLHLQQLPVSDPEQQLPAYDFAKLMQEMSLFDQWFVEQYLNIELTPAEQQLIQETYTLLANTALAQPQVVVHRDYHSRNLMVLEGQKTLGVIDFQDAVIGAYTYDLISILRDAYVQWPASRVTEWMQYFWQKLPEAQRAGKTLADFTREFDFMAAQRHLKVLGIFIRLNLRDGKTGYMKDLPLVFYYLLQEIKAHPDLQAFNTFLQQRILSVFLHKQPESRLMLEDFLA